MRYGNRSRVRQYLSSPLGIIVLVIAVVLLTRAAWTIHQKAVQSAAKLEEAQSELARLQAHQADLAAQVSYLSSEAGVEAELRTKYHAVKNGESVAVIVDDNSAAAANAASSTEALSWWQKMLHVFGL